LQLELLLAITAFVLDAERCASRHIDALTVHVDLHLLASLQRIGNASKLRDDCLSRARDLSRLGLLTMVGFTPST
jgi:hypothetical protein